MPQTQQEYFTKAGRLEHFYESFRGRDISPSPTRHAFRPDPGLILLMTRLEVQPDGQPHIPGNMQVWSEILRARRDSKISEAWAKKTNRSNSPDQLVDAMFALSREGSFGGPLQMYLLFSEIDRARPPQARLTPETVRLLASKFARFSDQYTMFSEFKKLDNTSIARFLTAAQALDRIPDRILRADAMGTMQANAGLWQILARQGQIPAARLNDSWQGVIGPFASVGSAVQLVDAGTPAFPKLDRRFG